MGVGGSTSIWLVEAVKASKHPTMHRPIKSKMSAMPRLRNP